MKRLLLALLLFLSLGEQTYSQVPDIIGTQRAYEIDPDAQTFLTAAGITDAATVTAVSSLVTNAKDHGWWTLCSAIYPFVGGTSATCLINLKTPGTFNITWVGSPTFTANGVAFNGTTQYGNTGLTPSTSLTQNSVHFSIFRTITGNLGAMASGVGNGTTVPYIELYVDGAEGANCRIFYAMSSLLEDGGTGFISGRNSWQCVSRSTSTNVNYFWNGNVVTTSSRASTGQATGSIFIGAENNGTGTASLFEGNIFKFSTIGADISTTIAPLMYSDIIEFNRTLVR